MKNQTDAQLVKRAKQGEHQALAELFRRYWRAARAGAYTVLGDVSLAEDAASEALIAAMAGLMGLNEPEKFAPWLHTIVIRTAQKSKNTRHRRKRVEQETTNHAKTESPEYELEQREWLELLHEAVDQLPPKQREAVLLFYFEGYTAEQAAAFVGTPVGTLKRRLHDGRKTLRHVVEQINAGRSPMTPKRQDILNQLEDLLHHEKDPEHVKNVIHQAMQLRPYPRDLMKKIAQRHFAELVDTPEKRAETERRLQRVVEVAAKPSDRVLDPDHAMGRVVQLIKKALPDFESFNHDPNSSVQRMMHVFSGQGHGIAQGLPPDIAKGQPCAYLYHARSLFFQDSEGIWRSMLEMSQQKELPKDDALKKAGLSDMLVLQWIQLDSLELHAVEQRLRDLVAAIIPEAVFSLAPHNSPRYRSGLRMQFDRSTLPAAMGGLLEPWPGLPEDRHAGTVVLCLEAWATALSGQDIELDNAKPFLDLMKK